MKKNPLPSLCQLSFVVALIGAETLWSGSSLITHGNTTELHISPVAPWIAAFAFIAGVAAFVVRGMRPKTKSHPALAAVGIGIAIITMIGSTVSYTSTNW